MRTSYPNLDVISGSMNMAGFDIESQYINNKQNILKTNLYSDKQTAINEFRAYRDSFQGNNIVDEKTTIIKRNSIDDVIFIKEIMRVKGEEYIMFLSEAIDG